MYARARGYGHTVFVCVRVCLLVHTPKNLIEKFNRCVNFFLLFLSFVFIFEIFSVAFYCVPFFFFLSFTPFNLSINISIPNTEEKIPYVPERNETKQNNQTLFFTRWGWCICVRVVACVRLFVILFTSILICYSRTVRLMAHAALGDEHNNTQPYWFVDGK